MFIVVAVPASLLLSLFCWLASFTPLGKAAQKAQENKRRIVL